MECNWHPHVDLGKETGYGKVISKAHRCVVTTQFKPDLDIPDHPTLVVYVLPQHYELCGHPEVVEP